MPGIRLYPASYAGPPGRHGLSSWFPVAFRLPAFASWAFLFPPRDSAFLAIGLPFTRVGCRDLDGVSVFRTNEIRVGSGASCTPGLRCSHSRRSCFGCRCRFSAASPVLRCFSHLPEFPITEPHQRFTAVHPSTLPLACSLRTGRRPLGFSPRLRTPQLPVTHARAGTGIEHFLSYAVDLYRPPIRVIHSFRATSRRTATVGLFGG